MKLVEILAKELEEWPPYAFVAVQDDDNDHTIWFLQSDHLDLSFMHGGWKCESPFDILISSPSQLAHDHATAIVTEADWKKEASSIPDQSAVGEIYNAQAIPQGPLQWRDRIAEIDSTTMALTTERAELVQKLASEGFALIGRINDLLADAAQKHEDMGDPKKWKVGDELEAIGGCGGFSFTGEVVKVLVVRDDGGFEVATESDPDYGWFFTEEESITDLKFHSRPSA